MLRRGQHCCETHGEPLLLREGSHLPPPVADGGVAFVSWLISSSGDPSQLASNGTESFMAKEDVPLSPRQHGPLSPRPAGLPLHLATHPFSIRHVSLGGRGRGGVLPRVCMFSTRCSRRRSSESAARSSAPQHQQIFLSDPAGA